MIVESALIIGGLSWVLDTVVEHSVGATGHELIREFVRGAMRELRDPDERESNHTIARAVRGAQIDALEMVLDGFAIGNDAELGSGTGHSGAEVPSGGC